MFKTDSRPCRVYVILVSIILLGLQGCVKEVSDPTPLSGKDANNQQLDLTLSAASSQVVLGGQIILTASGGRPPYQFSLLQGQGSISASGVYTPSAIGTSTIKVKDKKNATATVSITVIAATVQINLSSSSVLLSALTSITNPMTVVPSQKRHKHTATKLNDGRVLVVGGHSGQEQLSSVEIFDPKGNGGAGTWSSGPSLNTARDSHTATLLSNGKVLVVGGNNSTQLASVELFDPNANSGAGAWTVGPAVTVARQNHTATLLSSGKVLVAGGYKSPSPLKTVEIFDPTANGGLGAWSAGNSMGTSRYYHTATLLSNGKVLVVAGSDGLRLSSVEIYDPTTGTWSYGSAISNARYFHTSTPLSNGKILMAGGIGANGARLMTTEIYDVSANSWSAGHALTSAREQHSATLLPNGKVLIIGGTENGTSTGRLSSTELFDPTVNAGAGAVSTSVPMTSGRSNQQSVLLNDGRVLLIGGAGNNSEIHKESAVIAFYTSAQLSVSGGTGPYQFQFVTGNGSLLFNGSTSAYLIPNGIGNVQVKALDNAGNSSQSVSIQVK